jgi:hypothetical protein
VPDPTSLEDDRLEAGHRARVSGRASGDAAADNDYVGGLRTAQS